MPAISELNSAPYWDDFSPENKDFLRILFRPGYAVQARELNQLQSICQTQVERFGNHIFKEGSIVIGGMTTINTKSRKYIKIQDNYNGIEVIVSSFLNKTITGATSLAKAVVVAVADKEGSDPKTLIIQPLNGLDFDEYGETIIADSGANCFAAASGDISGASSTASIDSGIFYTKGFFVICPQQTTYLEKYTRFASVKAGLVSEIAIIDEGDDSTLLDNAAGSYNYAAPGAHRLKVNLIFSSKALDFTEDADRFIDLLEVRDGQLYKQVTTPIYSEIEKTLARRTYDESGDYTVRPFRADIQNHPSDDTKLRAYLEAGKAYVKGYEFETIARQYVDLDKPRSNTDDSTINNLSIGMNYGNYVVVTLDKGFPNISTLETLYLYNAANGELGACRISSIQYDSTVGSIKRYRFYIFAIFLAAGNGFSDIRSLRTGDTSTARSSNPTKKFSLVSVDSGATGALLGTDSASYIFETGLGAVRTFKTEDILSPGTFTSATDTAYQYKGVSTFASATSFTINVGSNETLQQTDSTTKTTHYTVIDTLSGATGPILDNYTVSLSEPFTTANITLPGATGPTTVAVIYTVNAKTTTPRIKTLIEPKTNSGYARLGPNSSTTVRLASTANSSVSNYYQNGLIKILYGTGAMTGATGFNISAYDETTQIATITGGTFASIPDESSYYQIAPPTTSFTYGSAAPEEKIKLGIKYFSTAISDTNSLSLTVPDGLRIVKILNSTSQADWFDPTKDVTSKFGFDNGQRDFTYEHSLLSLSPGQTVTGAINVFFEYYAHSGSGYFNVDSYPSYTKIPTFASSTGKIFNLTNCVDFRPVRNQESAAAGSGPYYSTVIPTSGTNMNADVTHWLSRIDKIVATADKSFKVLKGNSDIYPKQPDDLDNSMTLYTIRYNPYTFTNRDITLEYIDNKRYTMRDIGRIEKRIEKIEYYSLLNMLERETATLDVTDANGNDRFKNGFIVDTFTGHGIGDVGNMDYRCSIDSKNQEARPRFYTKNYDLLLKTSESTGYTQRGPLLSRTFTDADFVVQSFASQTVNVNPYSVFTWKGVMSINPSVDFWKDETRRPENIINVNGNNDNIKSGLDFAGSTWNNWENNFNGTEEDDRVEDRLARGELGANLPAATIDVLLTEDWRYEETNTVGGGGNVAGGTRNAQWRNFRTGEIRNAVIGRAAVNTQTARTNSGTSVQNQQSSTTTKTTTIKLGERVVDISSAQWMRTRTIVFTVSGMKPQSVVFPFFDDVSISSNVTFNIKKTGVTGASNSYTITVPDTFGLYVGQLVVGGTGTQNDRRIASITGNIITLTAANPGNIVATDTVTFQNYYVDYLTPSTPSNKTSPTGTLQGAVQITPGAISGTFVIPEGKFLVGDRMLRLSDNSTNDPDLETTFSQSRFTANGILIHKQSETINIRTTETVLPAPTAPTSNVPIGDPRFDFERFDENGNRIDPLAQTFFVDAAIFPNGLFIDSVDLFFKTKDPSLPVTVQIRPTVNGYPSSTVILPFAEKSLLPNFVNISDNGNSATTFTFPSIIYLEPGEYCIVCLTENTNYNLWIAEIGNKLIDTNILITQQPYIGSLFLSQNSSTWTAEQTKDMKFTLKRCSFNEGSFSVVLTDYITASAPTRIKTGTGNTGYYAIIVNDSDDLQVGQSVTGTGIGAAAEITAVAGFVIYLSVANTDTVSGNITFTGKSAGDGSADIVWVGLSTMEFPNTSVASSFISKRVNSSIESSYTNFLTNKNYEFTGRREIVANAESFKHRVIGNVTVNQVSPIIDMEKNNFIVIENDVNNITEQTTKTTETGATGFNATIINLDSSQFIQNGSLMKIGTEYMTVLAGGGTTGATGVTVKRGALGTGYAIGGATGTLVGATGIAAAATVYSLAETFPSGGSAASKYITRPIVLQSPADYLKVYATAVRLPGTDIKVYYKVKAAEDTDLLSNKSWVEMYREYPGDNSFSLSNSNFKEYIYGPEKTAYPENISYGAQNGWVTYNSFSEFAIKIVFLTSDPTVIPKIADFRAIALDRII